VFWDASAAKVSNDNLESESCSKFTDEGLCG
jgi:hypothetical protein